MGNELRAQYDQYLFSNYAPLAQVPARGEGARLWDTDGREYVDFAAGIAVSALGHAHPALVEVLYEQAQKFWHVSNLMVTEPAIRLARQLVESSFAERVMFANSGAEANEGALKLARRYAIERSGEEKIEIIAFDQAFHGRTFFTVSVGGQPKYSDGFGPNPAGITHLPFNDIAAFEAAVSDRTCAVILEPIQGEGGVNPATQEFVKAVRAACDRHDALLIFDEVQTGVMRTGDLYRYMALGVEPDILTTAKGLGGGFPISAVLAKSAVAEYLVTGSHGSTYAGNPIGCAVAGKVLEMVNTPGMRDQVRGLGQKLEVGVQEINDRYPIFSEVRSFGLLMGAQLVPDYAGRSRDLVRLALEEGLLVLVAGPDVLRLAPPLVLRDAELEAGLARLEKAVARLVA